MEISFLKLLMQIILAWIAISYLLTILKRSKFNPKRQPPSPLPFPIVGNLFSLKFSRPHKSFADLAKVHGPAMLIRLGFQRILVVSSPSMAREILGNENVVFSDRHVMHARDARWRLFRKICTTLVLDNERVEASLSVRRKALQQLICYVQICSKSGQEVNIGQATFVAVMNTLTNTFFSLDLSDHGLHYSSKLKDLVSSTLKELKCFDVSDFFSVLKIIDLKGNKSHVEDYYESMIQIFDRIIKTRLEQRKSAFCVTMQNNDVLDALLDLSSNPENEFKLSDIPHLLIDLFITGTDTISSTIEWAMTELLRNPEKMQKLQAELDNVINKDKKVEEIDFFRLPYLRGVVKETLRLHPPTPFSLPREVSNNTKLGEFTVPKNTKVLVNIWAIGRDPEVWENSNAFVPERFLDSSIDFRGQDFELIPFGSGSRMCVGMQLADKMVHSMLGTLIHEVNWKLQDGMKPDDIDVDDKMGFNLQKSKPMCVIPMLKNKLV